MKKLLLPLAFFAVASLNAQDIHAIKQDIGVVKNYPGDGIPYNTHTPRLVAPTPAATPQVGSKSAARAASNAIPIGRAGNLYTVLTDGVKPVYADDSIGTITFIHRGPTDVGAKNKGQYVFDVSKDNGVTWQTNLGPLNPTAIYVGTPSARFPQAVIHREAGNTNADSAYLVYTGAWLDYTSSGGGGDEWEGEYRGVGRLDGDTATFTESADAIAGGNVIVGEGMKKGADGVFWNLNLNSRTDIDVITGTTYRYNDSLIIMKGVWNNNTKDVDWTTTMFPHHARVVDVDGSGTAVTLISDFDIAFSPDGQTGWIALKGDFLDDGKYTYDPVFYKSIDGGNTWSAPIYVNLTSLQQIKYDLSPDLSKVATTINNADLIVDAFGNPHYVTLALSAAIVDQAGDTVPYNFYPNGGIGLYDITFDPNAGNGCEWKAIFIEEVISGNPGATVKDDGGAYIPLESRINTARSRDGKKIFFTWLDTDFIQGENPDPNDNFLKNISPNLFGKGLDVQTWKLTPTKNFTENDDLFAGNRVGTLGGALFPTVSPTTVENGSNYTVPTVLVDVDFAQPNVNNKLGVNPAQFYYFPDVKFNDSEFTEEWGDSLPPVITLNGSSTVTVLLNTAYNEEGAIAVDCEDGTVTPIVSGNVDVTTSGTYEIMYVATDNSGNSDTVYRTVIVGREPMANFGKRNEVAVGNAKRLTFEDKSLYSPTAWSWSFGVGATPAVSQAPNPTVTYTTAGNKCIKLTVSNSFGSDDTTICFDVVLGINEILFNQTLNVYPNPSNGKISIDVAGLDNEKVVISVMNTLGDVVLPTVSTTVNGSTTIEINGTTLAAGSYLVKVQAASAVAVKQISIVK